MNQNKYRWIAVAVLIFLNLFVISESMAEVTSSGSYTAGPGSFVFAPSVFYYSGLRSRSSQDEKSYLVGELKLAYQISTNIYLGAIYQQEQEDVKTSGYSSPAFNNTSESQRKSLGASLGYITSTYHVVLSYFVSSEWNLDTVTAASTDKYAYSGSGFQLDVGYKIPLWGFFLGPQISYKMFSYDELVTNGGTPASINPKLEDKKLEPALVFYYFF